jgi:phage-related protein
MRSRDTRSISWIKAARKAFDAFPKGARDETLRALTTAAEGGKLDTAKPLKGFGSGVFEVALKYQTDAYRTVYALQLGDDVWVLHAFQKKAKQGIKTQKKELDLVRERLRRLKKELKQ